MSSPAQLEEKHSTPFVNTFTHPTGEIGEVIQK